MSRTLGVWTMILVLALSYTGRTEDDSDKVKADKVKEMAEQWKEFSGTRDNVSASGLPEKMDIDFEKMGGRIFLFMLPKSTFTSQLGIKDLPDMSEHYDRIKSTGATDIIMNAGFTAMQGHVYGRGPAKLPEHVYGAESAKSGDGLLEAAEECRKRNIGMWIFMHGLGEDRCRDPKILKDHDSLYARDDKGELYKLIHTGKGASYDIMKEEVFQFLATQIDDLAEALKPSGCLKGFFWDEFWFNYQANFFQPYFPQFSDYCEKNFGERPPDEVREKIGLRDKWHDLNDKWWRRYVMWREQIIYDFEKKLCDYTQSKGYMVINQRVRRGAFDRPYSWLFSESPTDCRIGNYHSDGSRQNIYLPNATGICWIYGKDQSRNHASMVTGRPSCAFIYWAMLPLIPKYRDIITEGRGKDLYENYFALRGTYPEEIKLLFRDIRRWDGGEQLQTSAVLFSDRANIFSAITPSETFDRNEKVLTDTLGNYFPLRVIYTELPEYYSKYKLILTSGKTTLKGISPDAYAELRKFVENGGVLISIIPELTVSAKGDLTDEVSKTEELFGVKYSGTILPSEFKFEGDSPVDPGLKVRLLGQSCPAAEVTGADIKTIATLSYDNTRSSPGMTVKKIGRGTVIGIYFNFNNILLSENNSSSSGKVFASILADIIRGCSPAQPVSVSGDIRVEECVRKNGDIGITFLGGRTPPSAGTVKISPDVLEKTAEYTVTSRCRGTNDKIKSPAGSEKWTVAELANGIKVTVTAERGYELIEIEKIK